MEESGNYGVIDKSAATATAAATTTSSSSLAAMANWSSQVDDLTISE